MCNEFPNSFFAIRFETNIFDGAREVRDKAMLPELLFTGPSMQDISRDELTLLQTGCDKDSILTNNDSAFDRIKLGRTPELETLPASIKLEDTADAFQWNTTSSSSSNIESNLLRHSDDPLISGAIDDNQNEFDTLPNCSNSLSTMEKAASNYGNEKVASAPVAPPPRVRKSGNIKLRFHHQALPQEYLDHLEATQNQLHTKEMVLKPANSSTNSIRSSRRFDKIGNASTNQITATAATVTNSNDKNRSCNNDEQNVLKIKPQNGRDVLNSRLDSDQGDQGSQAIVAQNQSPKTHELPYMGEITLDNFKPRRGRKPKKADICHLIYKNYGTVFPNQKLDDIEMGGDTTASVAAAVQAVNQSLLERRLTTKSSSPDTNSQSKGGTQKKDGRVEEPLNLCVRDRYDSDVLTVLSDDDTIDADKLMDFKPELALLSHTLNDSNGKCPPSFKMAIPDFHTALLDGKNEISPDTAMEMDAAAATIASADLNSYGCWQNAGINPMLINPMVLYLQKIANANSKTGNNLNFGQSSVEASKIEAISPKSTKTNENDASPSRNRQKRMLVPKKMSQLLKDDVKIAEPEQLPSCSTMSTTPANKSSTANNQKTSGNGQPPKRKRSAIFIPPLPEESSTNHATEVSICKFKFTGGAKPSLQEKKSLQVDACGNFRYYSATGDKSIHGYEFFPRESLKQSSLLAASSAGAFLNTTGQKMDSNDVPPPPSFGLSNELVQMSEPNASNSVGLLAGQNPQQHQHHHSKPSDYMDGSSSSNSNRSNRKRKSKRSMQREKLEKTFKEKGFLIQTQQLEQAEGTYCKFRQLRKFTRYLFRSWKDYLPCELQQNQMNPTTAAAAAAAAAAAMGLNQNDAAALSMAENNGFDVTPASCAQFLPTPLSSLSLSPREEE